MRPGHRPMERPFCRCPHGDTFLTWTSTVTCPRLWWYAMVGGRPCLRCVGVRVRGTRTTACAIFFFLSPPGYWVAPPECSAWVDPPGSWFFTPGSCLLAIRVFAVSSSLFTCPQISSIVLTTVLPSSTSWILTPQGNSKHISVAKATGTSC